MKARSIERARLIYHLRVFDADRSRLLGHMVNITTDGLMLIGKVPVRAGRKLSLRMDMPAGFAAAERLTFSAESRWCRRDAGGEIWRSGFSMVSIDPEGLRAVRRLIRHFYQEEGPDDPEADRNPPLPDDTQTP
jgi:hypothetical protein